LDPIVPIIQKEDTFQGLDMYALRLDLANFRQLSDCLLGWYFLNYRSNQKFWAIFFTEKMFCIIFLQKMLLARFGPFFINSRGHPVCSRYPILKWERMFPFESPFLIKSVPKSQTEKMSFREKI
jgi:hypothetical protein